MLLVAETRIDTTSGSETHTNLITIQKAERVGGSLYDKLVSKYTVAMEEESQSTASITAMLANSYIVQGV